MGTFTGTEAGTGTFTVPNAGAGGTEEREAERRLPPEVREAVRRDTRGLVEIVGPNGEVGVDLQGRFQHVPVATANEDGSVTVEEH